MSIFLSEDVEEIFNRGPFYSCGELRLFRRRRRGQTEGAGVAIEASLSGASPEGLADVR